MRTSRVPGFLLLVSALSGAGCGGGEIDGLLEPGAAGGSTAGGTTGAGGGSAGTSAGGASGTGGTGGTAGKGGAGSGGKAGAGGVAGTGGKAGAAGTGGVTAGGAGGAGGGGAGGAGAGGAGNGGAGAGGAGGAGASGAGQGGAGQGGAGTGGAGMGGAGTGGVAGAGAGGVSGEGGGGQGGAGTGGAGMAGVGGAAQCQSATDCPTPENLCIIAICDGGQCAKGFVPANTPTSTQKAGDCSVTQCDGSGNLSTIVDDTDVPDDKNDCTADVCKDGVASNPPLVAGAKCGATMNLVCDGAGVCAGCVVASDCQGQDTACAKRTCNLGMCGTANEAAGTPAGDPTPGDCKSNQCDGNGAIIAVPSATDVPVDNNECTGDVCTNGTPGNPLAAAGTPCSKNGGALCDDTGACVACITANDCPGQDSECQARTCTAGACGVAFTPAGTAAASQTAGDCQRSQCDGAGKLEIVPDDLDVPADSNPCTSDVCTAGVPSNPPVGEGSACGQNGLCNDTGICVGCLTANDCPGQDGECQTRTCAAGMCGLAFKPEGTAVASQTAGDCKKNQCNGSGAIVNVPDAADLPVDSNLCTGDVCTNGTPTNPPVPLGTACGAGVCNASGSCVQCVVATTCPGQDNECQTRTCALGMCGFSFAPSGTLTAAQTAGDCKHNECNGAGATVNVSDNTDLPVDNNQCTSDVCTNGTPSNPPLGSGATCMQNGGAVCSGTGSCVQCVVATTCPGQDSECQTRTCTAGACGFSFAAAGTAVASQTAGDCKKNQCNGSGATVVVSDNTDLPVDGNTCTGDLCTAGVPSNPPVATGTACGSNGMCNAAGMCVGCLTPSTCPGTDNECQTRTCTAGACGFSYAAAGTAVASQTAGDCKKNQCNGSGVTVSAPDDTDVPVDSNQCTGDVCTLGTPSNPPLPSGTMCTQSGGAVCSGTGSCVQCVVATTCPGQDNECQTRTCTAGACGFSYAAAGTAVASQTTGDCKKNQCNGSGMVTSGADNTDLPVDTNQCTSDLCTNGVPSNPSVPVGTSCAQNGGNGCDNTGVCSAAPVVSSATPSNGTNAIATSDIVVTFSNAMNPATLTAQAAAGACAGSIQVSLDDFASCIALPTLTVGGGNTTATLKATPGLLVNRTYKIRVTTAATNAKGLALQTQFSQVNGFTATSPNTCTGSLVISQVYGGSGSANPTYKNDFVELHNRGASAIDLSTMSIQYASSTGTSWSKLDLAGSIPAGGYFLIQFAAGGNGGATLPAVDLTGSTDLSGGNGKVALVSTQTALSGACPLGATILDFVGYGTANCFEGTAAPAGGATTGQQRAQAGCGDGDTNNLDFTAILPAPRNSATPAAVCSCLAQNESGVSGEADYCTTFSPLLISVKTGIASPVVIGQIYELGVTEAAGASTVVRAQLGYGPATANPEYEAGWTWTAAPYKAQNGNNDDYQTTFIAPAVGTYRYAYRMSLDSGVSWTYCDNNQSDAGAGSNPNLSFEYKDLGVLTVTP